MKQKLKMLATDDRAVSPVIGVILMVAITVILAAVIGTFVLGLGQNIQTNVQAGASFNQINDTTTQVTFTSSQGSNVTLEVTASGANVNNTELTEIGNNTEVTDLDPGDTITVTASNEEGARTVIATRTHQ